MKMDQGKKAIQTNKKKWKIAVKNNRMKSASNFEKGHFGASKKQKPIWVPVPQSDFWTFQIISIFHDF